MKLAEVNTQILTLGMLDVFMYNTLPQFLSNSLKNFNYEHVFISRAKNSVYLDKLGSQKPAVLVLHCFKTGYIKSLAWKRDY